MEVREELRLEQKLCGDQAFVYTDIFKRTIIPEWNMTAGQLKRMPQYYRAIHAYSDTFTNSIARDTFYYDRTLRDWEYFLDTSMNWVIPVEGFYEMKQEIFDIARLYCFV